MLENEVQQLADYIEEMISDGVQLIHGRHLLDWNDTEIPGLIAKIKKKGKEREEGFARPKLKPGDKLVHQVSSQAMWVINDDGTIVYLITDAPTIKYPLDKILNDFHQI